MQNGRYFLGYFKKALDHHHKCNRFLLKNIHPVFLKYKQNALLTIGPGQNLNYYFYFISNHGLENEMTLFVFKF